MTLKLELPNAVAEKLQANYGDLSRKALEVLVVECYKRKVLSEYQVRLSLGHFSRWETDAFLKEHEAWLPTTAEEVLRDAENAQALVRK